MAVCRAVSFLLLNCGYSLSEYTALQCLQQVIEHLKVLTRYGKPEFLLYGMLFAKVVFERNPVWNREEVS